MLILWDNLVGRFRSFVRCAKHIDAPQPLTRKFRAKDGYSSSSHWACVKPHDACRRYVWGYCREYRPLLLHCLTSRHDRDRAFSASRWRFASRFDEKTVTLEDKESAYHAILRKSLCSGFGACPRCLCPGKLARWRGIERRGARRRRGQYFRGKPKQQRRRQY